MLRSPVVLLFGGFCVISSPQPSFAQQPTTRPAPADGGTSEVLESIFIPPKPHAPFSLTLQTEWVRTYADGNTVTLTNHRAVMRDDRGRIFEERRLLGPANHPANSRLSWLQYADPATHTVHNCNPYRKVCYIVGYDDSADASPETDPGVREFKAGTTTREDLGRRFILGLDTHGIRITTTLKPGVMGNSQPWVITREYWYSEALGINLLSIRNDPHSGRQTFAVSKIEITSPDPGRFLPPTDFAVVDQRPPDARKP